MQAATRIWWQNSRKRENSWVQRSTGRRQVRFNIMGLRCAGTCHLPQAEHHLHTHVTVSRALAIGEVCRCCGLAVCSGLCVQRLALLGWDLRCLVVPWHSCAGQCLDDTLGLGLQGLTVLQARK